MTPLFQTWPRWASSGLALLLLAALVLLIYQGVLLPNWKNIQRANDDIAQTKLSAAQFKARGLELDHLQRQLKAIQQRQANSPIFLRQANSDLAGAWLQERIKSNLQRSNAKIRSMQAIPPGPEEKLSAGLKKITIRVRFSAPMKAIMNSIHALEAQTPFVITQRVEIRSTRRTRIRRNRQREMVLNPDLNVILDVTGFHLSPSK